MANITRNLLAKGGYNNLIGLSSSIGKDIVPRVAGYFDAQPISDVIEVVVNIPKHRIARLMSDPLTQETH